MLSDYNTAEAQLKLSAVTPAKEEQWQKVTPRLCTLCEMNNLPYSQLKKRQPALRRIKTTRILRGRLTPGKVPKL